MVFEAETHICFLKLSPGDRSCGQNSRAGLSERVWGLVGKKYNNYWCHLFGSYHSTGRKQADTNLHYAIIPEAATVTVLMTELLC